MLGVEGIRCPSSHCCCSCCSASISAARCCSAYVTCSFSFLLHGERLFRVIHHLLHLGRTTIKVTAGIRHVLLNVVPGAHVDEHLLRGHDVPSNEERGGDRHEHLVGVLPLTILGLHYLGVTLNGLLIGDEPAADTIQCVVGGSEVLDVGVQLLVHVLQLLDGDVCAAHGRVEWILR
ncbi:hypothetical protein AGDE_03629 [Angomonas deanei]|nr:hypothetical protein AGDE_03629 [Angomonas deanei]|eukprot:EPY40299.1 hypothetical protein AGDE_03629 [Angomonas deanei]